MTPPPRLGAYSLERELGRGGMGSVWLARHAEHDSLHALKLVSLASDPELLERFRIEGEAMGRVQPHPNLTRVHALLEAEGWLGLVLEYCPGGDLETRLRQGPLHPEAARGLALALASGLEVAHAAGVLHRDLKPANVIFDDSDRPKLTDFGLAKLHDRQSLTQSGALLGTPSYMAPEQATTGACDARTDVYGLGGVLYHCLSGRPPFSGGTVLAVLDQVLNAAPAALPASVPPALARACLRALAKDPGERFPDAGSFRAALGSEVRSPGPGRALLGSAALFVVALLGGALLHASLSPAPQPNSTPTPTPAPPQPTPATPLPAPSARVVPGLLPWPSQAPAALDQRASLLFLQELAQRESLVLPVVFARHLQWKIQKPQRLTNLAASQGPLLRPSMHLRAFERAGRSLVALTPHFRGSNTPEDGFSGDPAELELFLLGLLRNGDPLVRGPLLQFYDDPKRRRLERLLERAEHDVLAWRALGLRAADLLDAQSSGKWVEFVVIPPKKARQFLRSTWAELASLSAYTFQLGLTLPPPEDGLSDLELRASTMSSLEGGDAHVLLAGACAGSLPAARGLAKHLLERDSERERLVGRALSAITFLAGDDVTREAMATGGELALAGIQAPKGRPSDPLIEIRAQISSILGQAGLLGGPPRRAAVAVLPETPPQPQGELDVRALLEEFLPEAPILQCLWREALLAHGSQAGSVQARQLRDAVGHKGLSGLKGLTKSLGDPKSHYYDPILSTRLALRLVLTGQNGTTVILYRQIASNRFEPTNLLLSSCLGLSQKFDTTPLASGVVGTSQRALKVPELAEAWLPLRALDIELSARPYRRASDRLGPPPRRSLEDFVRAASGTFPPLRWLSRSSQKAYDNNPTGGRLLERALQKEAPRTRLLMAAFRRGVLAALPELLQDHKRIRGSPLLRAALVQFLLSSEEGPLAERESWKLALKVLPEIHFPRLADLLQGLMAEPQRADLWRVFYRERERVFFRLGLPSQPELAAWGTPQEVLSGSGD